jgi:hypothetical protein
MAAWWTMAEEFASQASKGKGKAKVAAVDLGISYRVREMILFAFCSVTLKLTAKELDRPSFLLRRPNRPRRTAYHIEPDDVCYAVWCRPALPIPRSALFLDAL